MQVGVPLDEMMGLRGLPGLWILAWPKNLGQLKHEGWSLQYSGIGMDQVWLRESSLLATLLSVAGMGVLG